MALSRRQLIAAGGAGATAVLIYALYPGAHKDRDFVMSVVRHNLAYLSFGETMLQQFADDFVLHETLPDPGSLMLGATLTRLAVSPIRHYRERFERFERRVVSRFLLSTDFFQNGRRIDELLTYNGLADPYETLCSNVIARLA